MFVARVVSFSKFIVFCNIPVVTLNFFNQFVNNFFQLINFFFFQNYDTSESKLRREFEAYGTVKQVTTGSLSLMRIWFLLVSEKRWQKLLWSREALCPQWVQWSIMASQHSLMSFYVNKRQNLERLLLYGLTCGYLPINVGSWLLYGFEDQSDLWHLS